MRARGRLAPTTPAPRTVSARLRTLALAVALFAGLRRPALGLVRFNDGTDQIYVNGTYSITHASNIDASAGGGPDTFSTYAAQVEYQRHAGLIGVNASAEFSWLRYVRNRSYDTMNPTFSLEFDKGTGRETGTLGFSAIRSAQSDTAAGVHDVSWDYIADLKLKYPVIERYFLTASLDASYLDYVVTGGQPLVNLTTYGASTGLFYVLSDERDLFATYRIREEDSSDHTSTTDNAIYVGVNGQVFWEIQGSIGVGYQIRDARGLSTVDNTVLPGRYGSWTANGDLNWAVNRRLRLEATASKDFSTTSTDATTDTLSGALDATYAQDAHLSFTGGVGAGIVRFYGPFGLIPGLGIERRDTYFSWNVGGTYKLNSHFEATLAYNYFRNRSNLAFATFVNGSYSVTLTSRW